MNFQVQPTLALENRQVRVERLAQAGPRRERLEWLGKSSNLLAETPEVSWETSKGEYRLYGGHRLWLAPGQEARHAEAWELSAYSGEVTPNTWQALAATI